MGDTALRERASSREAVTERRPAGSPGPGGEGVSAVSRYLLEIRAYPPLTREQEHTLAHDLSVGRETARNELVQSNLGFVVKVAREYANLGLPFEDLLNEGNLGLIEAARRFDGSKGTKFVTYAVWWIRKSIFKALSDRSQLVRVPSYQLKKVREIRETERTLSASLGRRPRRDEISESLDRSVAKVDQALQFSIHGVSLDQGVGPERDRPIAEFLVDESCRTAEDEMIRREDRDLVNQAMSVLTAQEKTVLGYRYGLETGRAMTLKQVGVILKISRERVRQIECRAKGRIRKIFDDRRSIKSPPIRPGDGRPRQARARSVH